MSTRVCPVSHCATTGWCCRYMPWHAQCTGKEAVHPSPIPLISHLRCLRYTVAAGAMERGCACPHPPALPHPSTAVQLRSLRCIVAGGSMVHAYMAQPPDQFAGDLDIFCKPVRCIGSCEVYWHVRGVMVCPRRCIVHRQWRTGESLQLADELPQNGPPAAPT